jgi:hypothetical protein
VELASLLAEEHRYTVSDCEWGEGGGRGGGGGGEGGRKEVRTWKTYGSIENLIL